MAFTEVNIITDNSDFKEIMTAELGEIGFDTFQETEEGLNAYIPEEAFDLSALDEIVLQYKELFDFSFSLNSVEKENWNKKWEENYESIEVDDRCIVRASFHKIQKEYPIEIIITPKMSFGTGHHATTWQMLKLQMDVDFKDKKVLDVGTGTGVLAIMAAKLGADHLEGTDVDQWCIENSLENFEANGLKNIRVQKGEIRTLEFEGQFDIVPANINKNVLLDEIDRYSDLLVNNGKLFLSGFYEKDIKDIVSCAEKYGLNQINCIIKDDWSAMVLEKS